MAQERIAARTRTVARRACLAGMRLATTAALASLAGPGALAAPAPGALAAVAPGALAALSAAALAAPAPLAARAAAPPPPSTSAPSSPAPATAPARAPAADHRQENKLLVRRYLTEVLAAGRLDHLDEIVAKTYVDRSMGASNERGPELARQTAKRIHAIFSKVEYDPQEMVAEDDRVAVHYLVLGTPRPDRGKPAPPPLALDGMAIFHVRNGRLQEVFVLNDQVTLFRQLGYALQPTAAAPPAGAVPARPPAGASPAPPGGPPGSAAPPAMPSNPPASPAQAPPPTPRP